MLDTVSASRIRIVQLGLAFRLHLAAGYAYPVGEVEYGNLGTSIHLDFCECGLVTQPQQPNGKYVQKARRNAFFFESVHTHCSTLNCAELHPPKGIDSLNPLWFSLSDEKARQGKSGATVTAAES